MPVKLRLARRGRKGIPFFHIVVADSRSPRDGRFIEKIGYYNPMTIPATIDIDRMKAYDWLTKGAQPTNTVRAILRYKGVTYWAHLMKGVAKGAITEEVATAKFEAWMSEKEQKVNAKMLATQDAKVALQKEMFGTPKKKAAPVVEATSDDSGAIDPEMDKMENAESGEGQ